MITRFLLLMCVVLACGVKPLRAETPTQAVDRVYQTFLVLYPKGTENASNELLAVSRKVANVQGVAVITPIMVRAKGWTEKDWKNNTVLVFANLIACLPPNKAIPILQQLRKNGGRSEGRCATDLLYIIRDYQDSLTTASGKRIPSP
jgi:hypothetical protein